MLLLPVANASILTARKYRHFLFGSMLARGILIVLFLSVAIADPVAAQAQGSPSPAASFQHQWKPGSQKYHLKENWLTHDLFVSGKPKHSQQSNSYSLTIDDSLVEPASFEEPSDSHIDDEKKTGPELEIAASFPVKNIAMLREELQLHQEAIKADDQTSETVKSSRLQILSNANDALQKCLELQDQRKHYDDEVEQIENEKSALKEQLERQIEPGTPDVDATTDSASLTSELKTRQSELEKKKKELEQIEAAIQFHSERVIQIPIDRAAAIEQQKELRESISTSVADDLDSQLRQLAQEIELFSLEAELLKLDSEERRQEAGAKHDPIRRDLKLREVKRLEVEVANWELAAQRLRDAEVAEDVQEAKAKAANVHWSIEPLADRNADLAAEQKDVVDKTQKLKMTLESITDQSEGIQKRRTEIEKKIEAAGLTATNGMLLVDLRRKLMTTGESHVQIRKLQNELRQVSLSNVSLQAERDELADPDAKVEQIISTEDLNTELAAKAKEFLTTKRDYLDQLIDDYQTYGKLISEVSQARKNLIEEINTTMAYVDKNAIWVRSSEPARFSDLNAARQGLDDFFDPVAWYDITEDVRQRMGNRIYESAIALFSIAFLIGANRRLRRGLEESKTS